MRYNASSKKDRPTFARRPVVALAGVRCRADSRVYHTGGAALHERGA